MANKMVVQKLTRLTLVRKGRAMAKHPDMRNGVVEVVKAEDASDWYGEFDAWLAGQDELGDDPLADFAEAAKESAKQHNNYPDADGPFAGPHNSFPIRRASDVVHAAQRLHNAKGNKAKIKARIIAIARSKGYALPTTWAKTEKSVNTEKALSLVRQLLGTLEETDGTPAEKSDETLTASDPSETPPADEKESAKNPPHSHSHSHVSTYGYQYSHTHPHGDQAHADMDNHDSSETAHAHEHVAKAGNPETDSLQADNEGLKKDLDTAKESAVALQAELASAKTEIEQLKTQLEVAEKAKTEAETKLASAESAAAEAKTKADRKPLVAPRPQETEKSVATITNDMKFDDAFATLMGRK